METVFEVLVETRRDGIEVVVISQDAAAVRINLFRVIFVMRA